MKQIIICILLAFISFSSSAQNLVPNGSFENYMACPLMLNLFNTHCVGWRSYTTTTADLYNSCATSTIFIYSNSVPANAATHQFAAHGNGYAGLFTYMPNSDHHRGYIATTLTSPMVTNVSYEISMSVSLGENLSYYGTDNLGVYLFDKGPLITGDNNALTFSPQISFSSYGPLIDSQNWVRLTKYFTADSAYDNIVIGGFYQNSSITTVVTANTLPGAQSSYYIVDSVVIRPVGNINNMYTDSVLCYGDTFQVPYTVGPNAAFTSTNVFTAQLSNSLGSFSGGVTVIGTKVGNTSGSINCLVPSSIAPGNNYKIRIISSTPLDSSNITAQNITIIAPVTIATSNSPICESDTLKLYCTTNTSSTTHMWSGPVGYTSTMKNPVRLPATPAMSGDYIITTSMGTKCKSKDTITIQIKPYPQNRTLLANSPVCEGQTLNISASSSSPGTTYAWSGPNSFVSLLQNISLTNVSQNAAGKYIVTYALNGCSIKDSVYIIVKESPIPVTASVNTPVCEPETIHFNCTNSTQGATYTWSGPNGYTANEQNMKRTNTNIPMSGRYIVVATLNGCSDSDTVNAVVNPSPGDITITSNSPVCIHDTLKLNAFNDSTKASYTWSGPEDFTANGATVLIAPFTPNRIGNYVVTVALGDCKKILAADVAFIDPNIEFGNNETLCKGETKLLKATINTASYLWQDGSTFDEYTIKQAGTYWVQATTKCGITSDTVSITYEECECAPFIPTAFTPNNDGLNDKLSAILNCVVSDYKFLIVNRFGQAVFKSNNRQEKWDGFFNGQPAELGTYYYMLQLTGSRGKQFIFKGDITLIR